MTPHEIYHKISENIKKVMKGQEISIRHLLAAFTSGGHVLLEDYPGTGKTTLAKALSLSIDSDFKRIQFTPDLLPSDILGVSVFNQKENAFSLHRGPIFTNILLADEINRASPRTQSALLEAMAENQVSIDGKLIPLENHFFVVATQNPVETSGTYPLPEAQMDRFALKFSLGYISLENEVAVLTDQKTSHPIDHLEKCVTLENVLALKAEISNILMSDEIKRYIVEIVRATRTAPGVQVGASPRASLALMKIAKALALFDGMGFVIPEHVQEIAVPVIAHRLVIDPQARFSGKSAIGIVEEILKKITVPA